MDELSAMGQPTWPSQLFIPQWSVTVAAPAFFEWEGQGEPRPS